ncbi:hypothetical protein FRC08_006651 [Ceratobasidium sp. 394]|nr:hypothetical protein FRC08_006651 [Ceratobasidium sp. 394]
MVKRTSLQVFDVTLEPPREGGRPPRIYKITLKHVAEISPTYTYLIFFSKSIVLTPLPRRLLDRYQRGQQSYESKITTALTAINVVVRMEPIM